MSKIRVKISPLCLTWPQISLLILTIFGCLLSLTIIFFSDYLSELFELNHPFENLRQQIEIANRKYIFLQIQTFFPIINFSISLCSIIYIGGNLFAVKCINCFMLYLICFNQLLLTFYSSLTLIYFVIDLMFVRLIIYVVIVINDVFIDSVYHNFFQVSKSIISNSPIDNLNQPESMPDF